MTQSCCARRWRRRSRRRASGSSARPRTFPGCSRSSLASDRTWRSWTCGCRRRIRRRAWRPHGTSAGRSPRLPSSCCRSTSRRATRSISSARTLAGIGYLLKERVTRLDDLADAVRRVAAGGSVIDPEVVARLLGRPRSHSPLDELTLARARDPRADGRGPLECRDRPAAHARAQDRRGPRPRGLLEAGTRARGRGPSAGARRACLPRDAGPAAS